MKPQALADIKSCFLRRSSSKLAKAESKKMDSIHTAFNTSNSLLGMGTDERSIIDHSSKKVDAQLVGGLAAIKIPWISSLPIVLAVSTGVMHLGSFHVTK